MNLGTLVPDLELKVQCASEVQVVTWALKSSDWKPTTEKKLYLYWVLQRNKTETDGQNTKEKHFNTNCWMIKLEFNNNNKKKEFNKLPETSNTWMAELFQKEWKNKNENIRSLRMVLPLFISVLNAFTHTIITTLQGTWYYYLHCTKIKLRHRKSK